MTKDMMTKRTQQGRNDKLIEMFVIYLSYFSIMNAKVLLFHLLKCENVLVLSVIYGIIPGMVTFWAVFLYFFTLERLVDNLRLEKEK